MNDSTILIELPTRPGFVKEVIERRLRFFEEYAGLEEGKGLSISDEVYATLEDLSEGSVDFALAAVDLLLRSDSIHGFPYTITMKDAKEAELTRELVQAYQASPCYRASIVSPGIPERAVVDTFLKISQ